MGWIELCKVVHTAQRQTLMQIPIGFYANLSVSLSVSVSGSLNASLRPHVFYGGLPTQFKVALYNMFYHSVFLCVAQEERLEILQALSRQLSLHDDVDLKHFAESCEHFTGADFKGMAK